MRLPIILVQNPPAVGAALAEALVGNLIGRAGLDLTLVDRFDSIRPDSTDRMTLDGITVPSAILDWRSPTEMLSQLSAIGFDGVRASHQLDEAKADQSGGPSRRLFLFDLTQQHDAMAVIAELDRLRKSLSVKTFSLGSTGTKTGDATAVAVDPIETESAKAVDSAVSPAAPNEAVSTDVVPGEIRSDENLDALIDQLDDLDV